MLRIIISIIAIATAKRTSRDDERLKYKNTLSSMRKRTNLTPRTIVVIRTIVVPFSMRTIFKRQPQNVCRNDGASSKCFANAHACFNIFITSSHVIAIIQCDTVRRLCRVQTPDPGSEMNYCACAHLLRSCHEKINFNRKTCCEYARI
jgi:hypothetical protein